MSTLRSAGQIFDPAFQILMPWDLDRTSFDTSAFTADLIGCLSADPRAQNHLAELKHRVTNTVRFDPFQLLASLGISHVELSKLLHAYIKEQYGPDHTYLYPDVVPAITRIGALPYMHQQILTSGSEETQRFKLGLCPALQHLPQTITAGDKGELLEACFLSDGRILYRDQIYAGLVLVEDTHKAILAIDRRTSFLAVHVLRPDAKYTDKTGRSGADVIEVSSLAGLPALLGDWLARQPAS